MIEIKDLLGLSPPLTRLFEIIATGIGRISNPHLTRKQAEADAYAVATMSAAISAARQENKLPVVYKKGGISISSSEPYALVSEGEMSLEERVAARVKFQEEKKQINIENTIAHAAEELNHFSEVPSERPSDEWITRFFSIIQDISSEQMQYLWGLILAGEARKPGTFSLRTLDFMRNISKSDALTMKKILPFLAWVDDGYHVLLPDILLNNPEINVKFEDFILLSDLGVLHPESRLFITVNLNENDKIATAIFRDVVLRLKWDGKRIQTLEVDCWKCTRVGDELFSTFKGDSSRNFIESVAKWFSQKGFDVEIESMSDEKNQQVKLEQRTDV